MLQNTQSIYKMKKSILVLAISLVSLVSSFAQDAEKDTTKFGKLSFDDLKTLLKGRYQIEDNGNISIVKVVENINVPVDLMYIRAKDYFVYKYVSGKAVMQFEDKENKSLIFQGVYPNFHRIFDLFVNDYDCTHIVKIDFKEGKFRIIVTPKNYTQNLHSRGGVHEIRLPMEKMFPSQERSVNVTKRQGALLFYKVVLEMEKTAKELEDAIKQGNTYKSEARSNW